MIASFAEEVVDAEVESSGKRSGDGLSSRAEAKVASEWLFDDHPHARPAGVAESRDDGREQFRADGQIMRTGRRRPSRRRVRPGNVPGFVVVARDVSAAARATAQGVGASTREIADRCLVPAAIVQRPRGKATPTTGTSRTAALDLA